MSKHKQFQSFCAKCYNLINHDEDGNLVLSCGDFICTNCCLSYCLHNNNEVTCPACNKLKLKVLRLKDKFLPEEVTMSMTG
jgi:hypothetical protein